MERAIRRIIALVVCLIALPAVVESAWGESFDENLLDVLREQGTITGNPYEELKRKAQAEAAAPAEALPPVAAAQDDPTGWKMYWQNGTTVKRNDGLFKVTFGGRIQLDAAGIITDDTLNAAMPGLRGAGTEFRRARFFMQGSFYEHGIFKAQYDFAGSDKVKFKDVWIGLRKLPAVGQLRAGHFKEGFSLNEMASSKYITFMERALPVLAFAPSRNTGLAAQNTAFDKQMTWTVGVFADVGSDGDRDVSSASNYNVNTRLTGLPVYSDDGRKLVHLGLGYTHSFVNNLVSFDAGEVHLSGDLVDTGDVLAKGIDRLGLEFASVFGSLSFQGEWISTWVNQIAAPDLHFMGAYAQVSWFVTGEHRLYKKASGTFSRVKPKNPFAPTKGDWGGLELAARYSYLDLSDENIQGGTQNNTTLGVNWYLYPNLRIMFNWVYSHLNGVGNENAVMTRIAVDF